MSSSAIRVRRAEPEDAKAISALYSQLVSNPAVSVLPERICQVSQDPNTALLVCTAGNLTVGTALVSLCADVMFGSQPFAVVENIVVDSGSRSKGIGTALWQNIETLCSSKGCSKIMLLSSIQRESAHRFFERCGFQGHAKRGFVKYRRSFAVQA